MANAGPNTNGSQWFIVHGADVGLPPNYTIFGQLLPTAATCWTRWPHRRSRQSRSGENSQPTERLAIQ